MQIFIKRLIPALFVISLAVPNAGLANVGSTTSSNAIDCDSAELRTKAEAGDADSQNDLGRCLIFSDDEADKVEARKWFKAAMDQGHVEAKNGYGAILAQGIGGPVDAKRARKLIERAAKEGSYGAQLTLADQYIEGGGYYKKNAAKGLKLLIQTAESGRLQGRSLGQIQWRIGMMHREGKGTQKDLETAYAWVVKAADNDAIDGMLSRAVMLATAEGVAEDDVAARGWYKRAAYSKQKDFAHGLRGLGAMLWFGEGGEKDHAKGCMMLNVAYRTGDDHAETILKEIALKLSGDVKTKCNEDAQKWIDENLE